MKVLIACLLMISPAIWAQQDSLSTHTNQEVIMSEIVADSLMAPTISPAQFNNGMRALRTYIAENFNFYNINKKELILDTEESYYTVYIMFDINTNGQPENFKPVNTTAENSVYKEAIRVIRSGNWIPASKNGKPVRQTLTLPVSVYAEDLIEQ